MCFRQIFPLVLGAALSRKGWAAHVALLPSAPPSHFMLAEPINHEIFTRQKSGHTKNNPIFRVDLSALQKLSKQLMNWSQQFGKTMGR